MSFRGTKSGAWRAVSATGLQGRGCHERLRDPEMAPNDSTFDWEQR